MRIAIINNMPTPYRTDLYNYLYNNYNFDFTVIYSTSNEDNRSWSNDINMEYKYKILNSRTIKISKKVDYKYIHIPINIISTLNDLNPDIVIGHEYNPTVYLAYNWTKRKSKKFISWSDGTVNTERNINWMQRKIRKIICSKADSFIASSTKTKEVQISYGAEEKKIFKSYLTVDINKYRVNKTRYGCLNLLYVGRLIRGKGIDLLFNALKDIKNNFCLSIVGNGPEEYELKRLTYELGISDKVIFCGYKNRDEITGQYKRADIFIMPTREDCFGLVITEAMCAGLPIICSKYADGAYDLIEEGKNGFIVDPYNSKELKERIEYLLTTPSKVKMMGEYSSKLVSDFSIEKVSEKFIDAINFCQNKKEFSISKIMN
jgi:glycosyltransferase involved in cell wall biosynthesis